MFNLKDYLESGVVESYCLGTATEEEAEQLIKYCELYPEVKAYLDKTQETMEIYLSAFKRKAPDRSKNIILESILENKKLDNAKLEGEEAMLQEFFQITKHTDIEKVEALIKDIHPPTEFDEIFAKPLFVSDTHELILVWAKNLVPDEVHDDVDERFLLLEGTADCYVDDEVFHMKRGDYMKIPLHINHKVIVTSDVPGKAIRSRVKVG